MQAARSFQHSRSAEPVKASLAALGASSDLDGTCLTPSGASTWPPAWLSEVHLMYYRITVLPTLPCPSLGIKEGVHLAYSSILFQRYVRLLKDHDPLSVPTDRTDELGCFILFLRSDFPVPAPPGLHQAGALQHLVILVHMPRDRRRLLEILEACTSTRRLHRLPGCPPWPSRSKEQIFYGKEASPLAVSRGSCAVSHEKTMCSVGNRLVSPHGVSACAAIESIFPVFFCPSNPLRMHQLELTVNLRPNAPGGPRWEAEVALEKKCRIIGVNLDNWRRINRTTCPSIITDIGAIFVPFSPRILAYTLENFQYKNDSDWRYNDEQYRKLGYVLTGNVATIPPKPIPSFLFAKKI